MQWIVFTALLFFSLADAAPIYRWVDENDIVQFSDQPPRADVERLETPPPNVLETRARPKTTAMPGRAPRVGQVEEPLIRDSSTDEEVDPAGRLVCLKARLRLRELSDYRRRGYRASEERALDVEQRRINELLREDC